jgi:hypothetical protein
MQLICSKQSADLEQVHPRPKFWAFTSDFHIQHIEGYLFTSPTHKHEKLDQTPQCERLGMQMQLPGPIIMTSLF